MIANENMPRGTQDRLINCEEHGWCLRWYEGSCVKCVNRRVWQLEGQIDVYPLPGLMEDWTDDSLLRVMATGYTPTLIFMRD